MVLNVSGVRCLLLNDVQHILTFVFSWFSSLLMLCISLFKTLMFLQLNSRMAWSRFRFWSFILRMRISFTRSLYWAFPLMSVDVWILTFSIMSAASCVLRISYIPYIYYNFRLGVENLNQYKWLAFMVVILDRKVDFVVHCHVLFDGLAIINDMSWTKQPTCSKILLTNKVIRLFLPAHWQGIFTLFHWLGNLPVE